MKSNPNNRAGLLAMCAAAVLFTAGAALHLTALEQPALAQIPPTDLIFAVNASTSNAARLIAKAYGVDHANAIEAMAFSFNIQHGDVQTRREWYWDVSDNRIEYRGEGPTGLPISLVYHRDNLNKGDAQLNKRIDAQFVDDQYWLLFPFHLAWEKNLQVAHQPERRMYIEPRDAECVSVRYGAGSPEEGDVYDVFVGPDRLIREWAYRPQGAAEPAFVTTWERHAKAGPILFSLMHRSSDGSFRVWYDRVSVKLATEGWVDAEPLEKSLTEAPLRALASAKKP